MTYSESIQWLFAQFPAYHNLGVAAYKPGLQHIEELCNRFNNPQKELRFVHVAGTNGKGSVSHFTASCLQEAGHQVGLFTSPHLFDFRERIRVNGKMINASFVVDFCTQIQQLKFEIKPSFFEITWAMALVFFKSKNCTIVVAEVGLGGRLDATNIIQSEVSVITSIGLDHQAILGNTRSEIALEKAGIIKKNTPLVIGEHDNEILTVFNKVANQKQAKIYFSEKATKYPLGIIGYQQQNCDIVKKVLQLLNEKGFACSEAEFERGIENSSRNTGFIGRMQKVRSYPQTYVDCAHNVHGVLALFKTIKEVSKNGKLIVIYGSSSDKNIEEIIALIPSDAKLILTSFSSERSATDTALKNASQKREKDSTIFNDPLLAYEFAKNFANEEDTILIFGSFFLIHDFFHFFSANDLRN